MIKIGITGSIASGKTTVAKILAKKKYPLFSADKIVKKLYKKKTFLKKLKKIIQIEKNKYFKKNLREIIIKGKKKLEKLESLIHPIVRKEMRNFTIRNKGKRICVYEIPLLFESKLSNYFNIIIFVHSKKNIREKRYLAKHNDKKLFLFLNNKQLKPKKKIMLSDFLINNNKSLIELRKNVSIVSKKI